MTENEVIKGLIFLKEKLYNGIFQDRLNCIDLAIAALEELQEYRKIGTVEECKSLASIYSMADKCELAKIIDEYLKYIKIGTIEECREAIELQKPKKPIPINHKEYADKIVNAEFLEDAYLCPNCKTVIRSGSHCGRCGQKLNWNLTEVRDGRNAKKI